MSTVSGDTIAGQMKLKNILSHFWSNIRNGLGYTAKTRILRRQHTCSLAIAVIWKQ
jgi:hypothetical protein